jgi:adenosine deaminase
VATSIPDHPITLLRDLGFTVTVNTDNRLMSGTTMTREMTLLVAEAGWTLGDLEAATLAAAFHAFASYDVMRQVIMEHVLPGFAAAGAALGDDPAGER